MTSIAPTPDVVDLTTPSGPLPAWSAAVTVSRWTLDPASFAQPCAPWCTEHGAAGHPASALPEDRRCVSAIATVLLAAHRGDDGALDDERPDPARAEVALTQAHDGAGPLVEVVAQDYAWEPGRGSTRRRTAPLELRPAEARALAALLVTAADAATAGGAR